MYKNRKLLNCIEVNTIQNFIRHIFKKMCEEQYTIPHMFVNSLVPFFWPVF